MPGTRPRRATVSGLLALLLLGLSVTLQFQQPALFDGVRRVAFDIYMRIKPRQPGNLPLAVVHIDERSVRGLGPWPWPADRLARLIDRLRASGAVMVGLDMALQARPGEGESGELLASLRQFPSVAGTALLDQGNQVSRAYRKAGFALIGVPADLALPRFSGTLDIRQELLAGATGIGALNVYPEPDGGIRRYPMLFDLHGKPFPSFAAEVLRVASGAVSFAIKTDGAGDSSSESISQSARLSMKIGSLVIPLDGRGRVWVNFARASAWPVLSAAELLETSLPEPRLAGRLVLLGVSLPGVGASFVSPLGEVLSSSQLQAQVISQLSSGELLKRPSWALGG